MGNLWVGRRHQKEEGTLKKRERHFYLIEREHLRSALFGVAVFEGLMDMLRYDGATVENNAPDGYWLLSSENPPGVARWKSFGITIRVMDLCRNAFDIREILEDERKRAARRGKRLAETVGVDPRDG